MHHSCIFCVFVAVMVLTGCSTAENGTSGTVQSSSAASSHVPTATATASSTAPKAPPTAAQGTRVITFDPWAEDSLESAAPAISLGPSEDNWCAASRVTDRPDAYMCVFTGTGIHAPDAPCIRNPSVPDEYACLEQDLSWQVVRGLPFKGIGPSRQADAQGDYVYFKLTDGTICSDVSKSGMEPVGDYGFQGFCDDRTSYYSRFNTPDPPSDGASPFGEGTDGEGRWLVKTSSETPGQLTTRAVETAYR